MFYECILLIRPDVSAKHVAEVTRVLQNLIEKEGGSVIATEYWGFKTLAYRIEKRAKAHYVCLGISIASLTAIYAHLKFHRDILRHLFIKKPKGLQFPTLQMQSSMGDLENQDLVESSLKDDLTPVEGFSDGEDTDTSDHKGDL